MFQKTKMIDPYDCDTDTDVEDSDVSDRAQSTSQAYTNDNIKEATNNLDDDVISFATVVQRSSKRIAEKHAQAIKQAAKIDALADNPNRNKRAYIDEHDRLLLLKKSRNESLEKDPLPNFFHFEAGSVDEHAKVSCNSDSRTKSTTQKTRMDKNALTAQATSRQTDLRIVHTVSMLPSEPATNYYESKRRFTDTFSDEFVSGSLPDKPVASENSERDNSNKSIINTLEHYKFSIVKSPIITYQNLLTPQFYVLFKKAVSNVIVNYKYGLAIFYYKRFNYGTIHVTAVQFGKNENIIKKYHVCDIGVVAEDQPFLGGNSKVRRDRLASIKAMDESISVPFAKGIGKMILCNPLGDVVSVVEDSPNGCTISLYRVFNYDTLRPIISSTDSADLARLNQNNRISSKREPNTKLYWVGTHYFLLLSNIACDIYKVLFPDRGFTHQEHKFTNTLCKRYTDVANSNEQE